MSYKARCGDPYAHWGEIPVYNVQYEVFPEHCIIQKETLVIGWQISKNDDAQHNVYKSGNNM